MTDDRLLAAAAAGALGSEDEHRELLKGIVEVARAIFGSQAASIFLYDEDTDELVFEAVSGEGEDHLVGMRLPSSTGVAGWVLVTRQQLVLDDTESDERFGRGAAESTGYVPKRLLAVPLLHEESALGVLEVLDPPAGSRDPLADMELLALFAAQASAALALLKRARRARAALEGESGAAALVARVASLLERREDTSSLRLLEALAEVLETQ
jgi:GAF domain-containing protein